MEYFSSLEFLYTHGIFFLEILPNQTEIRFYLPISDWFGYKRTSVVFQINRCMVNTIWFRVDLIWFRKDFEMISKRSLCVFSVQVDHASRHNGDPIEGSFPTLQVPHCRYMNSWVGGGGVHNWPAIMHTSRAVLRFLLVIPSIEISGFIGHFIYTNGRF